VQTFCGLGGEEGFFRCVLTHFLVQKASDFLKFMVCPYQQGEGVNFSRFCVEVFPERPLVFSIFYHLICCLFKATKLNHRKVPLTSLSALSKVIIAKCLI